MKEPREIVLLQVVIQDSMVAIYRSPNINILGTIPAKWENSKKHPYSWGVHETRLSVYSSAYTHI